MVEKGDVLSSGSWEDSQAEKDIFDKDEFKQLEEGDNLVRLIGHYIFKNVHYSKEWGRSYVVCGGDGCPACSSGNLPKIHYYINILDRKDDKMKILKFGITLKRKFQNIVQKYGDITTYDIIITRKGLNLDTKYEVLPMKESKPITDNLKKYMIDNFVDLETKFETPTSAKILEMMSSDSNGQSRPQAQTQKADNRPAAQSNDVAGVKKDCFGQKFNPINPNCISCELKENCKNMTIEFYTTGGPTKK
jgi:hypothetical protein